MCPTRPWLLWRAATDVTPAAAIPSPGHWPSLRVLGIDPGTARLGYGLVEGDGAHLQVQGCGTLTTEATLSLPQRLAEIYRAVRRLVDESAADVVAVEELFFSRNVRTAFAVGQARGVVLLAAAHAGLPVVEYTPQQVKQAVTGYGAAPKEQVQEMVRVLLNLAEVPRPDDTADALAVAICHLHASRWQALLNNAD
ncbi:MAG: crossover junction endodeoxyribonuclease RuvC [Chloroflexi bacterium]|nr:crossover junction endodeoxyribonuclease RuvC [Chloroflexota bacterium]